MFMKAMFANHPYSRDMLGTESSSGKVFHKDIANLFNKMNKTENLTIMLGGNFDKDMWLEKIEKNYNGHDRGTKQLENYKLQEIKEDIFLYETAKKEQSHVMYGFRGLALSSPERYALQLIQSVLAGQGGRLFLELRDKNSLAYSVSPMRLEGIETGYFGAYIGCSPEKAKKALSMMKEQFDLLSNELVPAAELDRAKRYIVGRHDIDLQRTGSVVTSVLYNDIYGIDYNEPFNCAEKYFSVTAEDVRKLSQKIFGQKSVISVVGPMDPREMK
jgi:zinc protease